MRRDSVEQMIGGPTSIVMECRVAAVCVAESKPASRELLPR
jgi:hypothetical protein